MTSKTTTHDVGIFIRDMIGDRDPFSIVDWSGDLPSETDETDRVYSVDADDPSNLILFCESGAVFTVRIFRTA